MQINQAIETLNEKGDKKCVLALTLKHGEVVKILDGLIEVEIDLEYHPSRPMIKFKAPRFVDIFRTKKA